MPSLQEREDERLGYQRGAWYVAGAALALYLLLPLLRPLLRRLL
jgi:hypothetical protein